MNRLLERWSKLPRSQRGLVSGLVYLLVAALFYFALISPTLTEIDQAEGLKKDLTSKRDTVRAKAANRAALQAELDALAAQFKVALTELPDDREIPGLLSEIDGHARKAGLEVRKFQPLPEVVHEYYAEIPVQIVMGGTYHEVALFFDAVSKMNRIVSVKDIEMGTPKANGTQVDLAVSGKVVTFRFLTQEEIDKGRDKMKKDKKKGGAKGEGGGE